MVAFMNALNVFDWTMPPFSSCLILELWGPTLDRSAHQNTDQYQVQMSYLNQTGYIPGWIETREIGEPIAMPLNKTLTQFHSQIEPLIVKGQISWADKCH